MDEAFRDLERRAAAGDQEAQLELARLEEEIDGLGAKLEEAVEYLVRAALRGTHDDGLYELATYLRRSLESMAFAVVGGEGSQVDTLVGVHERGDRVVLSVEKDGLTTRLSKLETLDVVAAARREEPPLSVSAPRDIVRRWLALVAARDLPRRPDPVVEFGEAVRRLLDRANESRTGDAAVTEADVADVVQGLVGPASSRTSDERRTTWFGHASGGRRTVILASRRPGLTVLGVLAQDVAGSPLAEEAWPEFQPYQGEAPDEEDAWRDWRMRGVPARVYLVGEPWTARLARVAATNEVVDAWAARVRDARTKRARSQERRDGAADDLEQVVLRLVPGADTGRLFGVLESLFRSVLRERKDGWFDPGAPEVHAWQHLNTGREQRRADVDRRALLVLKDRRGHDAKDVLIDVAEDPGVHEPTLYSYWTGGAKDSVSERLLALADERDDSRRIRIPASVAERWLVLRDAAPLSRNPGPDEEARDLERRAAAGDKEAEHALARLELERGVSPEEVLPRLEKLVQASYSPAYGDFVELALRTPSWVAFEEPQTPHWSHDSPEAAERRARRRVWEARSGLVERTVFKLRLLAGLGDRGAATFLRSLRREDLPSWIPKSPAVVKWPGPLQVKKLSKLELLSLASATARALSDLVFERVRGYLRQAIREADELVLATLAGRPEPPRGQEAVDAVNRAEADHDAELDLRRDLSGRQRPFTMREYSAVYAWRGATSYANLGAAHVGSVNAANYVLNRALDAFGHLRLAKAVEGGYAEIPPAAERLPKVYVEQAKADLRPILLDALRSPFHWAVF